MIICHCQNITDHDINAAIDWVRASDGKTIITPEKVYRALGRAADCGGCIPLFLSNMRSNNNLEVPMHLRSPLPAATQENHHERRQESHRLP